MAEAKEGHTQLLACTQQLQQQLVGSVSTVAHQHIATGLPVDLKQQQLPVLGHHHQELMAAHAPSQDEVMEYARYLGIDVEADANLLYIAEWALAAPIPEGWTVHLDAQGQEFFYNPTIKKTCYEHPMDEHYRELYQKKKAEKVAAGAQQNN